MTWAGFLSEMVSLESHYETGNINCFMVKYSEINYFVTN